MIHQKSKIIFITAILYLLNLSLVAQENWTHKVRIGGYPLSIEKVDSIIKHAESSNVFGIETDNDITGRYDSFLDPTEKLEAIKKVTDAAHAVGNYTFVYMAGLECITENADKKDYSFYKDHPDWVQRDIKGRPAIFASNLSSLGSKVSFIGKIGEDSFGQLIMDSLTAKQVDTSMILKSKELNTGATIVLNYDEDRAMVTHPGAMNELTFNDITSEKLSRAKHLHFSSFYLQPGLKNEVADMFKLAKENGLTNSFDMQWDPAEKWDMDYKKILPYVDVFLPNEQELLFLTRETDIVKALEKLSPTANNIIVKMGNKGSLSWDKHKTHSLKALLNKDVVDAIGAGDSFNAGFIFQYIRERDIKECQEFGNLVGAVNTTAAGGTGAFVNYEQIIKVAKEKFDYSG